MVNAIRPWQLLGKCVEILRDSCHAVGARANKSEFKDKSPCCTTRPMFHPPTTILGVHPGASSEAIERALAEKLRRIRDMAPPERDILEQAYRRARDQLLLGGKH